MGILATWIIVNFITFSYSLVMWGFAMQDRRWFQRLGFSEDAMDMAEEGVETEIQTAGVLFVFFIVGVVSYVTDPIGPRPLTVVSAVVGVLLTFSPIILAIFSIRRHRRREQVEQRNRQRAIESIGSR